MVIELAQRQTATLRTRQEGTLEDREKKKVKSKTSKYERQITHTVNKERLEPLLGKNKIAEGK